jgi:hypothetical protein
VVCLSKVTAGKGNAFWDAKAQRSKKKTLFMPFKQKNYRRAASNSQLLPIFAPENYQLLT